MLRVMMNIRPDPVVRYVFKKNLLRFCNETILEKRKKNNDRKHDVRKRRGITCARYTLDARLRLKGGPSRHNYGTTENTVSKNYRTSGVPTRRCRARTPAGAPLTAGRRYHCPRAPYHRDFFINALSYENKTKRTPDNDQTNEIADSAVFAVQRRFPRQRFTIPRTAAARRSPVPIAGRSVRVRKEHSEHVNDRRTGECDPVLQSEYAPSKPTHADFDDPAIRENTGRYAVPRNVSCRRTRVRRRNPLGELTRFYRFAFSASTRRTLAFRFGGVSRVTLTADTPTVVAVGAGLGPP